MKKCRKVKKLLSSYLDQETSKPDSDLVKRHLDDCLFCRQEYLKISQIKRLTLNKERKNLSGDYFIWRLKEKINSQKGKGALEKVGIGSLAGRLIPVPAGLAVLFFLFVLFSLRQQPIEYSLEERALRGDPVTIETAVELVLVGAGY